MFAEGIRCDGDAFFRDGFTSRQSVRLTGAIIQGTLDCRGSKFQRHNEERALVADSATISGDLDLGDKFHAIGTVSLRDARITGDLNCADGRFNGDGFAAIAAQGANITGSVSMEDSFLATGEVTFFNAGIGRNFECSNGRFDGSGDDRALFCAGLTVGGSIFERWV